MRRKEQGKNSRKRKGEIDPVAGAKRGCLQILLE
jgi:hypothetical protein